jgi:hypothetical protein
MIRRLSPDMFLSSSFITDETNPLRTRKSREASPVRQDRQATRNGVASGVCWNGPFALRQRPNREVTLDGKRNLYRIAHPYRQWITLAVRDNVSLRFRRWVGSTLRLPNESHAFAGRHSND